MQPTLYEGDFVFVNRLAYKLGTPVGRYHRIPLSARSRTRAIHQRVIGLPGETVKVENGRWYLSTITLFVNRISKLLQPTREPGFVPGNIYLY